jgi:xanthine dehydrogenase accessory factor
MVRTITKLYPQSVNREDVLIRAGRLAEEGKAYVLATVVRVERPASTRPGDRALVLPDGTLDGWVGGACSEPIVIREALRALGDGEPRLVRIGPPESGADAPADIVIAESSCASEGTVEVLVEPQVPRPLLAILGDGAAALTLAELARAVDWRVTTELSPDADAVVVATMGHADEDVLESALAGRAGYVGLVASSRRATVVLGALRERGLGEEALARVRSPAGLDLGPATQPEIAVAILAELVAWRHTRIGSESVLLEAVDPVCGMMVVVEAAGDAVVFEGVSYYFCAAGCRARFEAEPTRYATARL